MLCGSYYGTKSWTFLFGDSKNTTRTFQIIYCLFIVIGSAMNLKSVVNLSDAFTLFLAVPNLIAVFLLSDIIIKELKRYCKKYGIGLLGKSEERVLND
jgi:AGCS family alanine or glycine:cation symporter